MHQDLIEFLEDKLALAGLLPLEKQAELSTRILKERLDVVLPWAMEESGFDFWIIAARENCMDPVLKTLYPWDMPDVRRAGMLAFHRDTREGIIRKMVIGRSSPVMKAIYEQVQEPDEDIFKALGRVIEECNPDHIAINRSTVNGFCDGLSSTMYEELRTGLGKHATKLGDGEDLVVRWLQRVSSLEKDVMKILASITHDIINYSFSTQLIQVGQTTTTDIEWFMRNVINRLGFQYWFGPDINLQRKGNGNPQLIDEVILPGDLIHCDIGLKAIYVQLHTDMQWMAYVLKDGETTAPHELSSLFAQGKVLQDIVRKKMTPVVTGNDALLASLDAARAAGIQPMVYTHPLGTFGHGAGPTIGMYDRQEFILITGERIIRDQTCYALELNAAARVEIWDDQLVYMFLEEVICKDGLVDFVDGRQEELILV